VLRLLATLVLGLTVHSDHKGAVGSITFRGEVVNGLISAEYSVEALPGGASVAVAHVWTAHQRVNSDETMRVLLSKDATRAAIAWHGPNDWGLDTDARLALWLPGGEAWAVR
jgi:hypothetical protein